MSDETKEAERLRVARTDLAQMLSVSLSAALSNNLPAEAALIAALINAILLNQANDLLAKLRTTKPGA